MNKIRSYFFTGLFAALATSLAVGQTLLPQANTCAALPNQAALKAALVAATSAETNGLNNQMWGVVVDRDGIVCAVAFTGTNRGSQFPGSRIIAATKANTANSFSLDSTSSTGGSGQPYGLAISSANLYSATQPGGGLFGIAATNPVNVEAAYAGPALNFGTPYDPMVGQRIGGIATIGGGFALYDKNHHVVGAIGVSGDTACQDHNIGWRVRHNLGYDHMLAGGSLLPVGGVSGDPQHPDNILFDITNGVSASGYGHPVCANPSTETLPSVVP